MSDEEAKRAEEGEETLEALAFVIRGSLPASKSFVSQLIQLIYVVKGDQPKPGADIQGMSLIFQASVQLHLRMTKALPNQLNAYQPL